VKLQEVTARVGNRGRLLLAIYDPDYQINYVHNKNAAAGKGIYHLSGSILLLNDVCSVGK